MPPLEDEEHWKDLGFNNAMGQPTLFDPGDHFRVLHGIG